MNKKTLKGSIFINPNIECDADEAGNFMFQNSRWKAGLAVAFQLKTLRCRENGKRVDNTRGRLFGIVWLWCFLGENTVVFSIRLFPYCSVFQLGFYGISGLHVWRPRCLPRHCEIASFATFPLTCPARLSISIPCWAQ